MAVSALYPASPENVPTELTKATSSYKRHAWLAMLGLFAFMAIYFLLLAGFAYITYTSGVKLISSTDNDFSIGTALSLLCSGILTVFMAKSLFTMRKMGNPDGIEVTAENQAELFNFLHKLADEIGAPKPHKVFITNDVNAAVFYDLSLLNLLIPSKKNLIIGLGLVNVLTLAELKAVLAHEFGHFAQKSMIVGRWVYIAQQIISHIVSVRDWLDKLVRFISSIDLRIAWIGWILSLIIWSLRSLMDSLFKLVIIAERALSREMEFNADLVAVSVTGSDALINALYKLQAADHAWHTAMNIAGQTASNKLIIDDLFTAQTTTIKEMQRVLNDDSYGIPPQPTGESKDHRIFENAAARPPQMWSTHPANSDRETNAKAVYVAADIDDRSAWLLFNDAETLRQTMSLRLYNQETTKDFQVTSPVDAVAKNFSNISYSPEYRGAYLGRSPVRDFKTVKEIYDMAKVSEDTIDLEALYPETIHADLKSIRNLETEIETLKALMSGELKPSGGVIRHRGEDLTKEQIPNTIEDIQEEKKETLHNLMQHEADCRATALNIAKQFGNGWPEYLKNTLALLHCSDHLLSTVRNEQALVINTWNVITADGKVGFFEKKRMLKVCRNTDKIMRTVSEKLGQIELPQDINKELGIESWSKASPIFDFSPVDKNNWPQWVQEALNVMGRFEQVLALINNMLLEDLLGSEALLKKCYLDGTKPTMPPTTGKCTSDYPTLLSGEEYVLQKKLDLWNRFQLAHGVGPTLLRTAVALLIVGGTFYAGFASF